VYYRGAVIGRYYADVVVERSVVVEVKALPRITKESESQLTHYLRSTAMEVGLLLNFGPRPEFKRIVFSNALKPSIPQT
jgi:GxxExxY protein